MGLKVQSQFISVDFTLGIPLYAYDPIAEEKTTFTLTHIFVIILVLQAKRNLHMKYILVLISLLVMGCSSKSTPLSTNSNDYKVEKFKATIYHKTSKDEEKQAELYAPKLKFKAIDNHSYESQFSVGMQMFVSKYHSVVLKAGKHKVRFYYDAYSMKTATLNFQEGHKYLFDFYITSYRTPTLKRIQYWIYDLTDKKVVWGKKDDRVKY